jgi:hypothetical protein
MISLPERAGVHRSSVPAYTNTSQSHLPVRKYDSHPMDAIKIRNRARITFTSRNSTMKLLRCCLFFRLALLFETYRAEYIFPPEMDDERNANTPDTSSAPTPTLQG